MRTESFQNFTYANIHKTEQYLISIKFPTVPAQSRAAQTKSQEKLNGVPVNIQSRERVYTCIFTNIYTLRVLLALFSGARANSSARGRRAIHFIRPFVMQCTHMRAAAICVGRTPCSLSRETRCPVELLLSSLSSSPSCGGFLKTQIFTLRYSSASSLFPRCF